MRYIESRQIENVKSFCPSNGDYAYTKGQKSYLYIDGVLLEKDDAPLNIIVPRGRDFKDPYPFTSHGFTAGTKGRIGVPEFTIPKRHGVSIEDGTEIWKITRDGKQTLYAVFENNTFKRIAQWK